jgi:dTDP-4-dehydrorhamnose 3,5-epimerase-like enzyme
MEGNDLTVDDCQLLRLPQVNDGRGSLSFIEAQRHVPFVFERIYYLYDIPCGSMRGAHAHKQLEQLMIAISGSFDVELDDGFAKKTVHLSRPDEGLYICPMIWRDLKSFSDGAVCMVIASKKYDEADYFRSYGDFLEKRGA